MQEVPQAKRGLFVEPGRCAFAAIAYEAGLSVPARDEGRVEAFIDLTESAIAHETVIGVAAGSENDRSMDLDIALARCAWARNGRRT